VMLIKPLAAFIVFGLALAAARLLMKIPMPRRLQALLTRPIGVRGRERAREGRRGPL
jgi:hypothetical protein